MPRAAVFLDKDGTLVEDVPYNVDPALVRLLPGAAAGLRRLSAAGYALVVVTNQSGVARGFFTEADLHRLEVHLRRLLAAGGVALTGVYACPHLPDAPRPEYAGPCACRKPEPGLLVRAAREHGLDLRRSWMVGDILHDVEAGRRAGCRTVLLVPGGETAWHLGPHRLPHHLAGDLEEASRIILAVDGPRAAGPVARDGEGTGKIPAPEDLPGPERARLSDAPLPGRWPA